VVRFLGTGEWRADMSHPIVVTSRAGGNRSNSRLSGLWSFWRIFTQLFPTRCIDYISA